MSNRIRGVVFTLIVVAGSPALAAQESAAVSALENKAQALMQQGKPAEAVKVYEEAFQLAKQEYSGDLERLLHTQESLAIAYQRAHRPADALALLEKVVATAEAKFGPGEVPTALFLRNLGRAYVSAGRFDRAESCLKRALKILEEKLGPDDLKLIVVLSGLGSMHINKGTYAEAEPYFRREIQIIEKLVGPEFPEAIAAKNALVTVLYHTDRLGEAEAYLERTLEGLKPRVGKDHVPSAVLLNRLAWIKTIKGLYAEAEPMLIEARAVLEKQVGPEAVETGSVLGNLGELYRLTGRIEKAEPLLRQYVAIFEKSGVTSTGELTEAYLRLGKLLLDTGRLDDAEACFRRALQVSEATFGPKHPITAAARNGLDVLDQARGQKPGAPEKVKSARPDNEVEFGNDRLNAALALNNKATAAINAGHFDEAEPLMLRSLEQVEQRLGPNHPMTASILSNMSVAYRTFGRREKSVEYARRALAIREAKFGAEHPDTAASRKNLAATLIELGRTAEGLKLLDDSRRVRRRLLERYLPVLSEDEQIAMLGSRGEYAYEDALATAMSVRHLADIAELSASWILNHKAVALGALAQRAVLTRDAADPAAAPIVRDLTETRRRLAALAMAPVTQASNDEGSRRQFDELDARERDLSRQLGQALNRPVRDNPWIEVSEARSALPSDAVLVEFARYEVAQSTNIQGNLIEARGGFKPGRYAAWVIPPRNKGDVFVVDLGAAGPIDEAIAAVRLAMRMGGTPSGREGDGSSGTDDRGGLTRPGESKSRLETEGDAEKRLTPAIANLSRLLIRPVRTQIEPARRWVIAPDSSLWLVPWQALPLDDGRYAIERHLIHLVVSGRDLASPAGKISAEPPVHFADPDFDLDQAAIAPNSPQIPAPGGPTAAESAAVNRALPPGFHAARLPGTGTEADGVYPLLAKYTNAEPIVYKQADATEARFRELRRPRVLILSTHGLFLDQSEAPFAGRLPANPLLRCSLLLAGANHRVEAGGVSGDNQGLDGVLTGLEIVGSDLQGTSLVVLSACETGLGKVQSGEGVAGLRQAFQLAGAKSVVSTLWQIPDLESSRLMIGFFSHLSEGFGPASALRRAQLDEIYLRRSKSGAAHPYYWAAFTLTGQPGADWATELLGEDVGVPPAAPDVAKGPSADQRRRLDTSSPARPADAGAQAAGSSKLVAIPSPAPMTQPARNDTDNPFVDWAVMIVVVVCAVATARWWWLRGPQTTV